MLAVRQTLRRALPRSLKERIAASLATRRFPEFGAYERAVRGKTGLEVGGPSHLFRTALPLYRAAARVDGANFGVQTLWEGQLRAGPYFRSLGQRTGHQFICEATDLGGVADATYEFVLSSNCLEHVANPLKALKAWARVLRPGGALVLVLPSKDHTFDHRRPVTTFDHLVHDFERDVDEGDLTHLDEILRLHDLALDPPAGTPEQFRARSLDNARNRTLHHHVFDGAVIASALDFAGFTRVAGHSSPQGHFALAFKRA